MTEYVLPIVGMYFRPPAKALLSNLPMGTKLALRREPDNPHDSCAIAVELTLSDIDAKWHDRLREECAAWGHDFDELEPVVHVGYIGRDVAAKLAPRMDGRNGATVPASLAALGSGALAVEFELE